MVQTTRDAYANKITLLSFIILKKFVLYSKQWSWKAREQQQLSFCIKEHRLCSQAGQIKAGS